MNFDKHNEKVHVLSKAIYDCYKIGSEKKLRFKHGSTNSSRTEVDNQYQYLDISNLNEVILVDTENKIAYSEPNVSMEELVAETSKYNLVPQIVMEFPAITVGGGIQRAALESSSFRYGQFNDTCIEYEVITGDGSVLKATPESNSDLFYGMSGSYGTLGLLTLARIRLIDAFPYIKTEYFRTDGYESTIELLREKTKSDIQYLEALIFEKNRGVIITGTMSQKSRPEQRFRSAWNSWFHKHADSVMKDKDYFIEYVPLKDYLFRYDRGAFWMGEYAFPIVHMRPTYLNKLLFNPFLNTKILYKALHFMNWSQRFLLQDLYIPEENALNFLNFINKKYATYPIWLCPIKPTQTIQKLSPHYLKSEMLIDIGVWRRLSEEEENRYFELNRDIENEVQVLGGRKMLYAHAFYEESRFWEIYDKQWYSSIRQKYKADKVFPDIYQKVIVNKKFKYRPVRELYKFFFHLE